MIVVPRVIIAWVKSIGIHDKKRIRYEQELAIEVDLICRGIVEKIKRYIVWT